MMATLEAVTSHCTAQECYRASSPHTGFRPEGLQALHTDLSGLDNLRLVSPKNPNVQTYQNPNCMSCGMSAACHVLSPGLQ